MTFCAPDDPSWVLHAQSMEIHPERGEGQAWGAKLKVAGVPVFYLPWVQFPIDSRRKTGLLFPDIGSDSRAASTLLNLSISISRPTMTRFTDPDTSKSGVCFIRHKDAGSATRWASGK